MLFQNFLLLLHTNYSTSQKLKDEICEQNKLSEVRKETKQRTRVGGKNRLKTKNCANVTQ